MAFFFFCDKLTPMVLLRDRGVNHMRRLWNMCASLTTFTPRKFQSQYLGFFVG